MMEWIVKPSKAGTEVEPDCQLWYVCHCFCLIGWRPLCFLCTCEAGSCYCYPG